MTTTTVAVDTAPLRTTLKAGETLSAGEFLYSPNKRFRLTIQNNDLVLLDGDRACWSADPDGWQRSNQVVLRPDGHLVLCENGEWDRWSTERYAMRGMRNREEFEKIKNIYERLGGGRWNERYGRQRRVFVNDDGEVIRRDDNGSADGLVFSLLDDGNATITYQGTQLWSSGTTQRLSPRLPDSGKRTYLYVGETLFKNQSLVSQNEKFEVRMGEGNLAVRYKDGMTLWEQGRQPGYPSDKAALTVDGALIIFHDLPDTTWNSGTAGKGDRDTYVEIKHDGNMVLMSGESPIWTSNTAQTPAQMEENQAKPITSAKSGADSLQACECLERDQYLQSPNGRIRLVMQGDGNLVVYLINDGQYSPLWASGTTGYRAPFKAVLQVDGNLKLLGDDGGDRWSSGSRGLGASLKVQDDGNVVMYSEGKVIWATNTRDATNDPKPDPVKPGENKLWVQKAADSATNRLEAGQYLIRNQPLVSPNGQNRLVLQDDGNLVLYKTFFGNPMAVWNSNTYERDQPTKAVLQDDGNFRLLNDRNDERWASRSQGGNAVLTLQDDCNVIIVSGPVTIWATNTAQRPVTDTLKAGESRGVNEPLMSANQKHWLMMQSDSNCVFYADGKPAWASNDTAGIPKTGFRLREDGMFVLQDRDGDAGDMSKYHSKPAPGTTSMKVRDDGNLVMLDGNGQVIWSPNRSLMPPDSSFYTAASLPCDRLKTAEYILVNQSLASPNGSFFFNVSSDCISVKHKSGLTIWTQTIGVVPSRLVLQFDGNLVLESSDGKAIWAAGSNAWGGSNAFVMQDDGNAVVQSPGRIWETKNHFPATKGTTDRLSRGDILVHNQSLWSPNGKYQLQFTDNVMLSIRDTQSNQTKYWYLPDRNDVTGAKFLTLVDPGYLEIKDASNNTIWTNKIGTKPMKRDNEAWVSYAQNVDFVLQDDGNAVVLRDGKAMWTSNDWPSHSSTQFLTCCSLSKGSFLNVGDSLSPANGMVTLTMQGDGNLILTHKMFGPIWGSNTWSSSNPPDIDKVILQEDGNLVVYGRNGNARWASGTDKRWNENVELRVQGDGRAVIYSNGKQIWDTGIPNDMWGRPLW